jgi:uncharacterized Tic20 family protein
MAYEDLKALDELRKTGAITEEEYQREKQKVLDGAGASQAAPQDAAQGAPQSGYPPPPPPPPTYVVQPAGNRPLFGMAENTYLMLLHLSQLLGFLLPGVGFAAPIILWALNKDANPRVDAAGKQIFNFLISFAIYGIAAGVLVILLIGLLLLPAVGIVAFVFIIVAAVKANNGEVWDYPLTIKFFH